MEKWEVCIQPSETGLITTINAGTKRIATVPFTSVQQTEATANLIAATPELLDALIDLAEHVRPYIMKLGVRKGYSEMVRLAAADKVIAKVRGL